MKKSVCKLGLGLGLLTIGIVYIGMKTGFFETDEHLYDEYDSTLN